MSKANEIIGKLFDEYQPQTGSELQLCRDIIQVYEENGKPKDCQDDYAMALGYLGQALYWGWDGLEANTMEAFPYLCKAYELGNKDVLEVLGLSYSDGISIEDGRPENTRAMEYWTEGMQLGDGRCTLHWCLEKLNRGEMTEEAVDKLKAIFQDKERPIADAAAVLYLYYAEEGDGDTAWEWREKAIAADSDLMNSILFDEVEEEVGEDDWTDAEKEFDAFDDETEAQ